jgi:hypothetical protein
MQTLTDHASHDPAASDRFASDARRDRIALRRAIANPAIANTTQVEGSGTAADAKGAEVAPTVHTANISGCDTVQENCENVPVNCITPIASLPVSTFPSGLN